MYCHRCGAQNPDEAQYCMKCGQVIVGFSVAAGARGTMEQQSDAETYQRIGDTVGRPDVPSHLIAAVLITIFSSLCCCNPVGFIFGVVAVIYASQVDTKLAEGNMAGAKESSKKAKTWCWIAIIAILALTILYFIVCFSIGMFDSLIRHAPLGNTI